jgi:hypothetical protein
MYGRFDPPQGPAKLAQCNHLLSLLFAQDIAHVVAGYALRQIQCPEPTSLAGFQVITYGRFWVFTEVIKPINLSTVTDLI